MRRFIPSRLFVGLLLVTFASGLAALELRIPMYAIDFPYEGTKFRRDNQWLAIRDAGESDSVTLPVDLADGVYDVTLYTVGENDGRPAYQVHLNDRKVGDFQAPLASNTTEEGERFRSTWKGIEIERGDRIRVTAATDSENGSDIAWGRWSKIVFSRPFESVGETASLQTMTEGVYGEMKKWHRISLAFAGPDVGERSEPNPFTDFRLNVRFSHSASGKEYTVPGYYAADGFSGETGGESGSMWRVHFSPDEAGLWKWQCSFRQGQNIAMFPGDEYSKAVFFDGRNGELRIEESDKEGEDLRSKGRLEYTGERYLRFAETGSAFLKGGADSPENFLAYVDFDGIKPVHQQLNQERSGEAAESPLHHYKPHAGDWRGGDPSWKGGKGKNMVGALNYLASEGVNSVYFLTMNVTGDGDDVWPWTSHEERSRFDCSKLDQWEVIFSHMDQLGLMLHVVTQETENDQLLDSGGLGLQRKLYYRELIARFGHHPALVWNFGEENTNTDRQLSQFSDFFEANDPYGHPVVVHTYPGQYDRVYTPLLGHPNFEGPSLQMGNMRETHSETIKWIQRSREAGKNWVVCLDEIGPADTGVKPDVDDFWHDDVRRFALWGNLMAGGGGVEWYFGYKYAHNDLNCEDLRSRANMWRLTKIALNFFQEHLPFTEMASMDELTSDAGDYVFAKPGEVYCVYDPDGGEIRVDLSEGDGAFEVSWFDPRSGGELIEGVTLNGGLREVSLGRVPRMSGEDCVALVRKVE
jgi:hypothetical protein